MAGAADAVITDAIGVVGMLQQPQALVEDAAEATLRLYQIAEKIPNLFPDDQLEEWQEYGDDDMQVNPMTSDGFGDSNIDMPQGEEVPYESPQPVDSAASSSRRRCSC